MHKPSSSAVPADFRLHSYSYALPEENIAQQPADKRDGSRLLVLDREQDSIDFKQFSDVVDALPENSLLVANNSKVIPARMFGTKPTGGRIEFLLLTPLPLIGATESNGWNEARVEGLLRSSKPPRQGAEITILDGLRVIPEQRGEFGKWVVTLRWQGQLVDLVRSIGHLPLPPYIHRPDTEDDAKRYQTVYAREEKAGSVAAPTAGLHFTPEIRNRLADKGISWAEVTLYVGYGTFSPVRCADIRDHAMHKEYIEVPETTAQAIQEAKAQGRPVVAVGTTSARTLEGMFAQRENIEPFAGETDIFIYPGYEFRVVDALLTNFHLPESSLIIMVSALAGRERILEAYSAALDNGFRFFSYGDSMLIR
jgi:S-adenosylmethionine:tRNA ribosyltransferase-isomerase